MAVNDLSFSNNVNICFPGFFLILIEVITSLFVYVFVCWGAG